MLGNPGNLWHQEPEMTRVICIATGAACFATAAFADVYNFTVNPQTSSLASTLSASVELGGTFIGNYDQTTNPTGTRTLNFSIFGTRPPAPTNIAKNLSATGTAGGSPSSHPTGRFSLNVNAEARTVTLQGLDSNLIGSTQPTFGVTVSLTYQSFLTANPNYAYPFIVAIPIPLGNGQVTELTLHQESAVSGPLTPGSGSNTFNFALDVPVTVVATVSIGTTGAPPQSSTQTVHVTGTVTPNGDSASATLAMAISQTQVSTTPIPLPPDQPFDFPAPTGTGDPAHVLLTASINSSSVTIDGNVSLPALGARARCIADFDDGSGSGTPDGGVTLDDLLYYLGVYEQGSVHADLDDGSGTGIHDGGVTLDDLLFFLAHFEAGC
jgi:hypothetical protein